MNISTEPAGRRTSSRRPVLVAVDATNLVHRAYHAYASSDRRCREGKPVWALYGFARSLDKAVSEVTSRWRAPSGIVVCFDGPHDKCRRRNLDAGYKATRRAPDPDLSHQLGEAPRLTADAGLYTMVESGFEGDDGCASAATTARAEGWRCVIVTSDRDAFAHADANTRILRPVNGGGYEAVGVTEISARYGVPAGRWAEYAALRGDKSDELEGVAGIGDKTAGAIVTALAAADKTVWDVLAGDADARAALKARQVRLLDGGGDNYRRNRLLMDPVCDLDVDLAAAATSLRRDRIRAACVTHGVSDAAGALGSLLPNAEAAA